MTGFSLFWSEGVRTTFRTHVLNCRVNAFMCSSPKQWVQSVRNTTESSSKQKRAFQVGKTVQSCSKKESWKCLGFLFFLQADLNLNSEQAKGADRTTQGEGGMLWVVTLCVLTRFLRSNRTNSAEKQWGSFTIVSCKEMTQGDGNFLLF